MSPDFAGTATTGTARDACTRAAAACVAPLLPERSTRNATRARTATPTTQGHLRRRGARGGASETGGSETTASPFLAGLAGHFMVGASPFSEAPGRRLTPSPSPGGGEMG